MKVEQRDISDGCIARKSKPITEYLIGELASTVYDTLDGHSPLKEGICTHRYGYLTIEYIKEMRGEVGAFLTEAYIRIRQKNSERPSKKKTPWQLILSIAINEWNAKNPDKQIANYYTKVPVGEQNIHLWSASYKIKPIEKAFLLFGIQVEEQALKRKYHSKDELVQLMGEVSRFMQKYLDTLGETVWKKPNHPWHHVVSAVIGAWNKSHPTQMIYNYMSNQPGIVNGDGVVWQEKYGIKGKTQVLSFFGIKLPKKSKKIKSHSHVGGIMN